MEEKEKHMRAGQGGRRGYWACRPTDTTTLARLRNSAANLRGGRKMRLIQEKIDAMA